MQRKVSLDLFLLNKYGELMDSLCNIFTEQIPYHVNFIDCFSRGSYSVSGFRHTSKVKSIWLTLTPLNATIFDLL